METRIVSQREANALFKDCILELSASLDRPLDVLEAGCGRKWPFSSVAELLSITGVDANAESLKIRQRKEGDLENVVMGDLRQADLAAEDSFDVIYNSYVLEHVEGAEQVLDNMASWLRPGGLILVRFPDRNSVFGFCTRLTPHWFHVLYRRYVIGEKTAGEEGYGPFETFYDKVTARDEFRQWAAQNKFEVVDEMATINEPKPVVVFMKIVGALSFGFLAGSHVNLVYALRKQCP